MAPIARSTTAIWIALLLLLAASASASAAAQQVRSRAIFWCHRLVHHPLSCPTRGCPRSSRNLPTTDVNRSPNPYRAPCCRQVGRVGLETGAPCATECHEEDCHTFSIRYGRYCGVGHGGCAGGNAADGGGAAAGCFCAARGATRAARSGFHDPDAAATVCEGRATTGSGPYVCEGRATTGSGPFALLCPCSCRREALRPRRRLLQAARRVRGRRWGAALQQLLLPDVPAQLAACRGQQRLLQELADAGRLARRAAGRERWRPVAPRRACKPARCCSCSCTPPCPAPPAAATRRVPARLQGVCWTTSATSSS